MPRYRVIVSRRYVEEVPVVVDAPDAAHSVLQALRQVEHEQFDWERVQPGAPVELVEPGDVEEVDPGACALTELPSQSWGDED